MLIALTSRLWLNLFGVALATLVAAAWSPEASAHEVPSDRLRTLSDYEDSKGGPENVTEAERRAILRGQDPRVAGAAAVAAPRVRAAAVTPLPTLQALSDFEDATGGKEQVTEVERRAVLRGRTPRVLGAATEATAARAAAPSKVALHVLSDFEDARGGKESVSEIERLTILRGAVPRVKGVAVGVPAVTVRWLRGEITELTPEFVEVRYQDATGAVIHKKFALTADTDMRAHLRRGSQVEVRFEVGTATALVVRDLAPAGDEIRFGAGDCAACPGALA